MNLSTAVRSPRLWNVDLSEDQNSPGYPSRTYLDSPLCSLYAQLRIREDD